MKKSTSRSDQNRRSHRTALGIGLVASVLIHGGLLTAIHLDVPVLDDGEAETAERSFEDESMEVVRIEIQETTPTEAGGQTAALVERTEVAEAAAPNPTAEPVALERLPVIGEPSRAEPVRVAMNLSPQTALVSEAEKRPEQPLGGSDVNRGRWVGALGGSSLGEGSGLSVGMGTGHCPTRGEVMTLPGGITVGVPSQGALPNQPGIRMGGGIPGAWQGG